MPAGNPDSPVSRYGHATTIETHIESVTPTAPDTALVRFYTERRESGATGRRTRLLGFADPISLCR